MTLPPFIVRVFLNWHYINPGSRAWKAIGLLLVKKGIHNRLILAPEFRVDLSQQLIIRRDISNSLSDDFQLKVGTLVTTPGLPIGFCRTHKAVAIEGTVNVFNPFLVLGLRGR
jgi:hypothetical protein